MRIEDFIKHSPRCLASKYSTMGRCSCGAQAALEELAALRKAAQQSVQRTACKHEHTSIYLFDGSVMCHDCGAEVSPPPPHYHR